MNTYAEEVKAYLAETECKIEKWGMRALIEMLWYFYRPNIDEVKEEFRTLEPIIKTLSRKRQRKIVNTASEKCIEREQSAFLEGVRVGAALILELSE